MSVILRGPSSGLIAGSPHHLRGAEVFPSPFLDMASLAMPDNLWTALEWSEFIFMSNSTYRMAVDRIISYFLTDIEIESPSLNSQLSDEDKEKWYTTLTEHLHILSVIKQIDTDCECYGNAFVSVMLPIQRFLVCPRCKSQWDFETFAAEPIFKFRWTNWQFSGRCPTCSVGSGYSGPFLVDDKYRTQASDLIIKRWNPKEIVIVHDEFTDDIQYYWRIPAAYQQKIRQGHIFELARAPMVVIDCIKHNKMLGFNRNAIYHMKEPTLAGIKNRGWGLPRTLINFRQIWYVQLLHRYQEAIAADWILPIRLLTPVSRGGATAAGDALLSIAGNEFMSHMRRIIREHRLDPASWHFVPFPVQAVNVGGEGRQLAPHELLEQGMDTLMNGVGVPLELYRGTLQLQAYPAALRLFEATWHHRVNENNRFLRWLIKRIAALMQWELVSVRHARVTHADDIQRQMAILQLMASGAVSPVTALRGLGLDAIEEARQTAEFDRRMQELQQKVQEELDREMKGQQIASGMMAPGQPGMTPGQPPASGAAPAGAGGTPLSPPPITAFLQQGMMPSTPEEVIAAAQALAQQLLGLPESIKDSELRMLKQKKRVAAFASGQGAREDPESGPSARRGHVAGTVRRNDLWLTIPLWENTCPGYFLSTRRHGSIWMPT